MGEVVTMNSFRLLEHTADIGIAAAGESLAALFQQLALGMRQVMTETADIEPQRKIQLEVQAADRQELLVNWLGELLYRFEAEQFLPGCFEIDEICEQQLKASVWGETLDPKRHQLEREIKAITYHQIEVEPTANGWRAQVYVDL